MKKYYIPFFFLALLINTTHVHAGAATGGATFPMQIVQEGTALIAKHSTLINTAANVKTMIKDTILDPIANQLISAALQGSSKDILSWVTGGFDGAPSLILANPEAAILNAGVNAARSALTGLPQDGIFSASLFSTLKDAYKGSNDLKAQLQSLSQSSIPSLVQDTICSDAALTSLAINDIRDPQDGSYTQAQLTARKSELYNYACAGDPKTDQKLATRLNDLNTQNPSITGMEGFYSVAVRGENEFTRGQIAKDLVAKKVADDEEIKKLENYGGGQNAVSERECEIYEDDTAITDPNTPVGATKDPACLQWKTITPGATVGALFAKGQGAGLDRLTNIMGDGSLSSLLSGLATAFFNSSSRGGGVSSGSRPSNTPTVVSSSRPIVQDLSNDSTKKDETIGTIMSQIDSYDTTLKKLQGIDSSYLSDIAEYQNKVTQGKTCYDSLISNNTMSSSDPRATNAYSFYASRQSEINTRRNALNEEVIKVTRAISLNNEVRNALTSSNSTQEIGTIFRTYQSAIKKENLPEMGSDGTREAEYQASKSNTENDTSLTSYQNTCNQLTNNNNSNIP